ncbi:unnamed protein product [Rhizophagus irregularis]|nr:unnamed protein product [Rhizophagus irregularis]
MPLDDFYLKAMTKSDVADYINASGSRYGGACTAAIFLKEFVYGLGDEGTVGKDITSIDKEKKDDVVEGNIIDKDADEINKIRYAHIDMAGVMITSEDSCYDVKGATGRPTRSIIEVARRLAAPK